MTLRTAFVTAVVCLLAGSDATVAQQGVPAPAPSPAPAQEAPAPTAAAPAAAAPAAAAPDRPLAALPYSPVLDLASLDRNVDPCVDFYAFSCGGWERRNPIPPDQAAWSVYGKLYEDNIRFLWGLLEEARKPGAKRDAASAKTGDYFAACMDTAAIEQRGAAPLQDSLRAIDALRDKKSLASLLAREHLALNQGSMLFGFGSEQDASDSTQVIAAAYAGGIGLPDRDFYLGDDARSKELRERYRAHAARLFVLLGEDAQAAEVHAVTVLSIETDLARKSLTRVEKRDPHRIFNKRTRAQLAALTPSFDWDAYLAGVGLSKLRVLNVSEPAFFEGLEEQLGRRTLEEWKTYLRWHVVRARAPYLSSPFVDADFDFYGRALRGQEDLPARWKRCVGWVDRDLGEALGKLFVARAFSPQTKKDVQQMTQYVEKAMAQAIDQLDWMSDATKKAAHRKLDTMVNKIGYPDRWRDYRGLTVRPDDFAGNVERAVVFETKRSLRKIGRPVDRGEWGMTPPTVNAYYNPQMNDMNFPAGVLQPPLFDPASDAAPNYGNTGATIGHELIHGFDDEGRRFDAQGNLRDWWAPEDEKRFEERAQCVVDQYAQYVVVDDIRINSKLTAGEDIADLGGTRIAYVAWRLATEAQRLAPVDGFTPDQRFFIGMAQWVCGNERPENLRVRALTDPHSPGRYRINGVVSNLPEFADAFSCKQGQPMVRPQPCRIW